MIIFLLFIPFFIYANILVKYENLKPYYYENQVVNLKIKVITPRETNLSFYPTNNVVINSAKKVNSFIYELNTTVKMDKKLKNISISDTNKTINLNNFTIKTLPKIDNFSNIIADNLYISNILTSSYDKNRNIVSFDISCKQCNLEDFNLSTKEQKLILISPFKATFYTMIPKNRKYLEFLYFSPLKEEFKKVSIPIVLKENTISTQTDLNPKENIFLSPKNIVILSIIAFFIIIFLVYKKVWILIFPLLLSAYLIYTILPKGKITVYKNDKMYILPTKNSTVFYIIPQTKRVSVLSSYKNFKKIIYQDKIGWINENDR